MTLKIEVTVPYEHVHDRSAAEYLASAMSAIGYARQVVPFVGTITAEQAENIRAMGPGEVLTPVQRSVVDGSFSVRSATDEEREAAGVYTAAKLPTVLDEPSVQAAARKRGEPSPGKARRTKAEIAEDDAADRRDTIAGVEAATDTQLAISSGEERIDPNAAQDAVDEAVEAAANRTSDAPTLDDVRQLMGAVQRKHGMATAAKIPQLLGKGVAELTDAEIPDALARIQTLLDGDTPASALSADPAPAAPPATKADLIAAMLDYALFADGQNTDQAKMPNCMADVPVVFEKLFGVKTLSEVPADGYGKAVAGIAEMRQKDPFKRGAK